MSDYVNSCYSTDMDKFYAIYLSVIIVGKQTCMIPCDVHHTPSMAAYKMIRLNSNWRASPQFGTTEKLKSNRLHVYNVQ